MRFSSAITTAASRLRAAPCLALLPFIFIRSHHPATLCETLLLAFGLTCLPACLPTYPPAVITHPHIQNIVNDEFDTFLMMSYAARGGLLTYLVPLLLMAGGLAFQLLFVPLVFFRQWSDGVDGFFKMQDPILSFYSQFVWHLFYAAQLTFCCLNSATYPPFQSDASAFQTALHGSLLFTTAGILLSELFQYYENGPPSLAGWDLADQGTIWGVVAFYLMYTGEPDTSMAQVGR